MRPLRNEHFENVLVHASGALRDPDSKLEQLTSKLLGTPAWVSRSHLVDQRRVARLPSAASSWAPSPQKAGNRPAKGVLTAGLAHPVEFGRSA